MSKHRYLNEITQGPRYKSYATQLFEKIIQDILEGKNASYSYNILGELEVQIKDKVFNITHILSNQVDFRQLSFTDKQLDNFRIRGSWSFKDNSNLHRAEKSAILIYTSASYLKIQSFLRQDGRGSYSSDDIRQILLTTAIASHGLAKPINTTSNYEDVTILKQQRIMRKERKSSFVGQRINAIDNGNNIVTNQGFTSTCGGWGFYKDGIFCSISSELSQPQALNSLGKNIAQVSYLPGEDEVLFPPNTQIHYSNYKQTGLLFKKVTFEAKPVYSLDGIDPFSYSEEKAFRHEFTIIQQMFNKQYQTYKNGFFSRFFINKSRLNDLRVQVYIMDNFLKKEHITNRDLSELIDTLKQHNCSSNPAWPMIAKRLDRLSTQYQDISIGKTTEVVTSPY